MHTHSHKNHLQVDLIFRTPGPTNLSIYSHSILRLGKGLCKRPPLGSQFHIFRGATPKATFFLVNETKIRRKYVQKETLPTILNSEHYEFLSLVFVPLQSKPLCLCVSPHPHPRNPFQDWHSLPQPAQVRVARAHIRPDAPALSFIHVFPHSFILPSIQPTVILSL